MNGYERWLDSKNDGQISIDDEAARIRNPDWEWTRKQRIEKLITMAKQREEEAKFWWKHGNTLRATHLSQCAEGDRQLAAMLRR